MPEWRLAFPIVTLDDRINMRSAIGHLQTDPHHVRTVLEERQDRQWVYRVEFEGEPEDPEVLRVQRSYEHYPFPPLTDPPYSLHIQTLQPTRHDVPQEVRERILREYLANPRRAFPSPLLPLRSRIDYQAATRRTFLVETLPEGALPVYDRDPDPQTPPRTVMVSDQHNSPRDANLTSRLSRWSRLFGGDPMPPEPEPPTLPLWIVPGVWVRGRENQEMFACVVSIAADRQVTIRNWRRLPEEISLPVSDLERYWEVCQEPKEPALRFDRIMGDDFLANLATKTATVTIDGKPSFAIRLMQTFQKFFRPNGDSLPVNPEGAKTRFERLDRDE